jgi:hypothetical protein
MRTSSESLRAITAVLPQVLDRVEDGIRANTTGLVPSGADRSRVLELVRHGSELTLHCSRRRAMPGPAELEPYASWGRRAAEHGRPIFVLTRGVSLCYSVTIRAFLDLVPVDHHPELMPMISWGAALVPVVERTAVAAYLEHEQRTGHDGRSRQALAGALLRGLDVAALAAGLDVPRAGAYAVALVRPVGGPDRPVELPAAVLAAAGIALPRRGHLAALHPVPVGAGTAAATAFADRLAAAAATGGMPAHVALAWRPRPLVPAAYREALGVLRLARRRALPPGPVTVLSVVTDHLLGRDPVAATQLRGLLAPLTPELTDTLRRWLGCDADRRAAAAELHVHPNTLDRRLRRVEELTGLSTTRFTDQHLLQLAVSAST